MNQLDVFTNEVSVKWFEITKLPTIEWLHKYGVNVFGDLSKLDDSVLLKTWKAIQISNYCMRRNKSPRGHSRNSHILHQIGSSEKTKIVEKEMNKRGLDLIYGLDIANLKVTYF